MRVARVGRAVTLCFIAFWAILSAQAKTLSGTSDGAAYRIDTPSSEWNGSLVLYLTGLSISVPTPSALKISPFAEELLKQGFAVAQTGYASVGWNVEANLHDIAGLASVFRKTVGTPKKTYLVGESLGGYYAAILLERAHSGYDGGLTMCAPLTSADEFIIRRMLDVRVVFDSYFPDSLPSFESRKTDLSKMDVQAKVFSILEHDVDKASEVRNITGIKSNRELAAAVDIYSYLLTEIRNKTNGSPFDNMSTVYSGSSDDVDLNRRVRRYMADVDAFRTMMERYSLSGDLHAPLLALEPVYDPIVPSSFGNQYSLKVEEKGRGNLLVRRPVQERWHCKIPDEDLRKGFSDLMNWPSKSGQSSF